MSNFDPIIKKISDYVQNYQANEESLQEAKTCFFDSIACAFMALEHDQVKKFIDIDYIKNSQGSVRVVGTDLQTNVLDATFLNGALIRWLDFNDTWLAKEWGHPSDNLSIILALVDYLKSHRNTSLNFNEVLNYMVMAHEIQGALAIENSLNKEGLDHVALVKIASASVGAKILGHNDHQICAHIAIFQILELGKVGLREMHQLKHLNKYLFLKLVMKVIQQLCRQKTGVLMTF